MPNFSTKNEGVWFYFDKEHPDLGGICLRELTSEEAARIDKITVKHKRKVVRGAMVDVPEEDAKTATRLTWDYCITDWKNIQLDGEDMECNTENKVKMMNCIGFAKFMGDCITDLIGANKAIEEARVKNLQSSSSGRLRSQAAMSV